MTPIYFTADWHLFHDNILKFCHRPFKDITEMTEKLIKNYNSTVPENGFCYFMGDMGKGPFDEFRKIISSLNGTKFFIMGNHDKKSYGFFYKAGFSAVMHSAVIYIGQSRVSLSHCPLIGRYRENTGNMAGAVYGDNWYGESREKNFQYTIEANADFHLHGHCHAPNDGNSKPLEGNQYDIGVDANGFRPVSISKIGFLIDEYKRGLIKTPS